MKKTIEVASIKQEGDEDGDSDSESESEEDGNNAEWEKKVTKPVIVPTKKETTEVKKEEIDDVATKKPNEVTSTATPASKGTRKTHIRLLNFTHATNMMRPEGLALYDPIFHAIRRVVS